MNIHAISLIKNEEDIIEYNLKKACEWADKIYVLDNGSTDRTWEIVNDLASNQIIPVMVLNDPYEERHRSIPYNLFKNNCKEGDWWCYKLDADEFFIDDPRSFLKKVPRQYHVVYSDSIEYYLTFEDVEEHRYSGNFEEDKKKIRYYYPTTWSEYVFFRFRKRLKWPRDKDHPPHMGIPFHKKIRLQHYKYRSINQIKKRIETRLPYKGTRYWEHEKKSMNEVLMKRDDLIYDEFDGNYKYTGCRNEYCKIPNWKKYILFLLHGSRIFP